MHILKKIILFYTGGLAYMIIEFIWRGRSHWSMFLLGGACFLLVGYLGNRLQRVPLYARLLLSAGIITALELLTGLLVNQNYSVWDYRNLRYNYLGQICLNYSLLWIPVSLGAILLYRAASNFLQRKTGA